MGELTMNTLETITQIYFNSQGMPRHDMNLSALAGLLKKEKYLLAQISADY